MKLSIGIVGLPNVGKSTLFKALTDNDITIANYPFATIDPNVGVVPVPDERLDKLAELSKSKKKIPAIVEFYDIAGLVKGANKGEGLGNQFLAHIREVSAIAHVVRVFKDDNVSHIEHTVDPARDIDIVNTELAMKDLETIEKIWKKVESEAKSGGQEAQKDLKILEQAKSLLENGTLLNSVDASSIRLNKRIKELNLLTAKPQIYVLNGSNNNVSEELKRKIKSQGADYVVVDLKKNDEYSHNEIDTLVTKAYEILGLITFFTTGEKETRAWTIKKGSLAPEAAGEIHSDFQKNFIKAEAIQWDKLIEAGGWSAAKAKGWIRLEGKEYEVQDGDVLIIKHG